MQHEFDIVARHTDPARIGFEKWSRSRQAKVLRQDPVNGKFMLSLSDEPSDETAFDKGESWQRWVAELVRREFPFGVCLFNRRRGTRGGKNLDIVAIIPSGVWVIDIQRHDRVKAEVRHTGSLATRRQFLYLDGDDCTHLVDEVDDEAAVVRTALRAIGRTDLRVKPVLCLVDIEPGWHSHAKVGDVLVSKARPMLKVLDNKPVRLSAQEIASLAIALDGQLPRNYPSS